MRRYLFLITALVLIVVVARLPARLLTEQLTAGSVQLLQPVGTLWNGRARLLAQGNDLGLLTWHTQSLSALRLSMTYALMGKTLALDGRVTLALTQKVAITMQGHLGNPLLQTQLNPYGIDAPGDITIEYLSTEVALRNRTLTRLVGKLGWDGGVVSHTLQQGTTRAHLPPLRAMLSVNEAQLPSAKVYGEDIDYPLLSASLTPAGVAELAITKRLTVLAGMPWPSREADHETVLKVGEKLF